ncbi:hypothetical protein NWT09_13200 [Mycolicibacterium sp. jd]|uniref:hypothetical protein n=1 Tax=unclassified Mycolicibacterium TaxID=2636767 RepID=UPI00351AFD63
MRENSATVQSRSLLLAAAMSRHPAGHALCQAHPIAADARAAVVDVVELVSAQRIPAVCPLCHGVGWVRAVAELPLQIVCPGCGVA